MTSRRLHPAHRSPGHFSAIARLAQGNFFELVNQHRECSNSRSFTRIRRAFLIVQRRFGASPSIERKNAMDRRMYVIGYNRWRLSRRVLNDVVNNSWIIRSFRWLILVQFGAPSLHFAFVAELSTILSTVLVDCPREEQR